MYIAVLFITVKTGKQPRHPLVSEWVNKVWYIQTTKYYSELKGNELSSHEKTWISVVLSCSVLSHFSCVQLFAILWTIACQAPLSMGFSRQEYWSGLPFPSSFTCTRKQKEFMWLALLQYLLYCSVLDPNLQYLQSMPIYSYTAILFGNKKKWSTDTCYNMDKLWKEGLSLCVCLSISPSLNLCYKQHFQQG